MGASFLGSLVYRRSGDDELESEKIKIKNKKEIELFIVHNLETLPARVHIYIEDITACSYFLYGYLQYPGWEY